MRKAEKAEKNRPLVVKLYQDGATVYQLAEHFGCSITPIKRILHEEGVTMRRGGWPKGRKRSA